jgi:hypothetical protein
VKVSTEAPTARRCDTPPVPEPTIATEPADPAAREGPSLQERFAPAGRCFGCGPANSKGLHIGSRPSRADEAVLVADFTPRPEHEAFSGVVNGGILGTLIDCHANWTAAWHLMRRRGLARRRP